MAYQFEYMYKIMVITSTNNFPMYYSKSHNYTLFINYLSRNSSTVIQNEFLNGNSKRLQLW